MRTRTFVLSFLVHAAMIGAAMVVRIAATTELPDPPHATAFVIARAELPEIPPPPVRRAPPASAPTVTHRAIPTEAPDSVAPELPSIADSVPIGSDGFIGVAGDPVGDPLGVAPPPALPPPSRAPEPRPPIRVGSVLRAPQKTHHVAPIYPQIAQAARVSGTVILEALIAEDGSVRDVKVLRSKPLLDEAAVDAVRQWRFTPTLLNGVPVQVIMSVTVTFTLN
jgi:protein TonB